MLQFRTLISVIGLERIDRREFLRSKVQFMMEPLVSIPLILLGPICLMGK